MILVIGAAYAGKRAFVERELGVAACDIANGVLDGRPCIDNLQELVRTYDGYPDHLSSGLIEELSRKQVIICDEMGCGVVPLDPDLSAWRECVGRLCCDLAARAQAVVRVSCGIPEWIKGRP